MEIGKNNQKVVEKLTSTRSNRTSGEIRNYPRVFAFGYILGSALNKNVKTN